MSACLKMVMLMSYFPEGEKGALHAVLGIFSAALAEKLLSSVKTIM